MKKAKKERKKPGTKKGFRRAKAKRTEDQVQSTYEMWDTLAGIFRHMGYVKISEDETRQDTLKLADDVLTEIKRIFINEK